MEEKLLQLVARDEIVAVLTDLFLRTDARDWAGVRECFADRVRFDMTSLAGGEPVTLSPGEITESWERGLRPLAAVHHQVGNFRVRVRPDDADASCYGIAWHYRPNRSGRATRTFVGSYDFHLGRDPQGWKIDAFRFDCKFVDGNLELEAGD